jgi:hypothetical protein
MSNTYQEPMADGGDHPLKPISPAILAAARQVLHDAADCHDVDPEMADPIADAVVMALLPWMSAS